MTASRVPFGKFFEAVPDVELKDDQRLFSHEQRLAIYRRDGGICQIATKCQGEKWDWDNWCAYHIAVRDTARGIGDWKVGQALRRGSKPDFRLTDRHNFGVVSGVS